MNIYQRINNVRKKIGYVQKDKSVSTGGGSYKAVTHDAVTGMVRAALIEEGVVIVPSVLEAVFHPKEPEAKQRLYEATYEIAFVNMEDPQDKIVTRQNAHALDNGDKAPGKAMSYATKYAMLKLFNIETGEDEESRYQQEEADVSAYLDAIKKSANMDSLKETYAEAITACGKDNESKAKVIAAKNERKNELSKAAS